MTDDKEQICEGCQKHVLGNTLYHRAGTSTCVKCLSPGQTLKVCSVCKFVFYCSKECQKKDWRTHKIGCRVACDIRERSKALGPEMEARYRSFETWCTNTGPFTHAAISALGLHSDWSRLSAFFLPSASAKYPELPLSDRYVFVVNVHTTSTLISSRLIGDGTDTELNFRFTNTLTSARCASMEELHACFDRRFKNGAHGLEWSLAHRPGLMRILFINDGFPFPLDHYTTPINIEPSNLLSTPFKPDWLQWLRSWLEEDPQEVNNCDDNPNRMDGRV